MQRRFPSTVGLGLLALSLVPLLSGCNDLLLLEPKGPIGDAERTVILEASALMLLVVVPVIVLSLWFPWRYRSSNSKAKYAPRWSHSYAIEAVVWLIPAAIIGALGVLVWSSTHRLDPYKPINPAAKPVHVEIVSLDWKWLFIYPELGIATVNQLVFPAKVPLEMRITSDTVMTAFFVPQLGSQIYAMAGMDTRLHLIANETGKYLGENTQFSGSGFPWMSFKAMATTRQDFDNWVEIVRQSPFALDEARLAQLEKPSAKTPVEYFSSVTPNLYESIMGKYMKMGREQTMSMPATEGESSLGGTNAAMTDPEPDSHPSGVLAAGSAMAAASTPARPAMQHIVIGEEN